MKRLAFPYFILIYAAFCFSARAAAIIDPNSQLPGIGFEQRRSESMIPEDKLVLEYLKQVQDFGSKEKQLLPSMGIEDIEAQTFNNSIVAMAFMLDGEKQRAERILDFYANAANKQNMDPTLQNFYYEREPRGFFQWVAIRDCNEKSAAELHSGTVAAKAYHHTGTANRWMGDMVWLLYAYKFYEKEYNSSKYNEIISLLRNHIVSSFIEVPGCGGYIASGWSKGDTKFNDDNGHHEGNIDCYAVLRLTGDVELAGKVKQWLDSQLNGRDDLPLDLYTWRTLSYGQNGDMLNVPDYDLRYRKTVIVNGKKAMGFYHGPDENINNIWLDGTGHIACAYLAYGDKQRGYFYANQLDSFLIDKTINGVKTRTLPYTANKTGGYDWVQTDKGFISVCAWYIMAKHKFNPMTLERNQ